MFLKCRGYLPVKGHRLIALIVLTMPGFYRNALYFHPDWMMTFFIVLSIFFSAKDEFKLGKSFWLSVLMCSLAVSTKVQAIMFLPYIIIYILRSLEWSNIYSTLIKCILLSFKVLFFLITFFVFTNPLVLHSIGRRAFLNLFFLNLESNNSNHGSGEVLSISSKIMNMMDFYDLGVIFFTIFLFISIAFVLSLFKKEVKKSIFPLVAVYILTNLFYLLIFVNQEWNHYYLPLFTVMPLLLVYFGFEKSRWNYIFLGVILIIQVTTHFDGYHYVFRRGYNDNELVKAPELEISESLIKTLAHEVDVSTNILISPFQPFDFESLGMDYRNVHVINGFLGKFHFELDAYLDKSTLKDSTSWLKKIL